MKKQNISLSIVFTVVFIIINVYSVNKYFIYTEVLSDGKNVSYTYLNKTIHSGGKGKYYIMEVEFDNRVYDVSLTEKQLSEIDKRNYPKLFLTKQDGLITDWNLILAKRVIVVTAIGFLISVVSFFVLISRRKKLK
ncbi:hypothetical protein [Flavobacterium sp. I3-2]|uniref:hypothetical protein n=1 Tax=Flavobacterium sp. I3-2 TaxID=2748319 RepID=UPI0015B2978F|nr:hypothetical protein [Flavobacterium sp. I3-2]